MATTPMMQQYQEAKRVCPDALLLFRMGDFYEMFHDDAKVAAATLNLGPQQAAIKDLTLLRWRGFLITN